MYKEINANIQSLFISVFHIKLYFQGLRKICRHNQR